MKKALLFILISIICSCVVACNNDTPNEGVIPTKEFTVSTYIQDNALYQRKSNMIISGTGEEGVNLIIELINDNNRVVSTLHNQVDKNGKWEVSLETPNGSFSNYQLRIYDEYNKFEKEFHNIRFGEVIMVMGDQIFKEEQIDNDEISLDFISCYYFDENGGSWLDLSKQSNLISNFYYNIAYKASNEIDLPIGLIINQASANLYEWLSVKNCNQVSLIKKYLEDNSLYNENPTNHGDMSYLDITRHKLLEDVKISKILWYHGDNELDYFNDDKYVNVYFQMLMSLIDSLINKYRNISIGLIESINNNHENVVKLRRIEEYVGNYYTNVKTIPTFDIEKKDMVENVVQRSFDILNGKLQISQYGNLITDIDEQTGIVNKIKIEINNTDEINIINKADKKIINYFNVFYDDPNEGLIVLDIIPTIVDNFIIIDLRYEEEIINEDEEVEIIEKVYDKNLIIIEYGMYANLNEVNIFNDDKLPILPFVIILD